MRLVYIGLLIAACSTILEIFKTKRWYRVAVVLTGLIVALVGAFFDEQEGSELRTDLRSAKTELTALRNLRLENSFILGVESRPYLETTLIVKRIQQEEGELDFFEWLGLWSYYQELQRDVKARYWALDIREPAVDSIGSPLWTDNVAAQIRASQGELAALLYKLGYTSRLVLHLLLFEQGQPYKRVYKQKEISENTYVSEPYDLGVQLTFDIPPLDWKSTEDWIEDLVKFSVQLPQLETEVSDLSTSFRAVGNVGVERDFELFVERVLTVVRDF